MPRRSKGARLELRRERRDHSGKITHHATWRIRDGDRDLSTGCLESNFAGAERKLQEYLAAKHQPKRKVQDIEDVEIADVLLIYLTDRRDLQQNKLQFDRRLKRLNAWWGGKKLSDVNGDSCRAYHRHRGNAGGARRDLEDLRAAINYHASEGLHRGIVKVVLPPKGQPRDRWLTRDEAARLLRACWRYRELQRRGRGGTKGPALPTEKRPLRHLARFILIGLYTGTRAAAIASASPVPAIGRSFVDLDAGLYYRKPAGSQETKKRRPTVPIPPRLLAHMRRWHERGLITEHFVEFNGKPVKTVKTAFKRAVTLAQLDPPASPHTLRHTAATWLMQNGVSLWTAAGFLGMGIETLQRVYGHHHPDYLRDATHGISYGARERRLNTHR
jgi:integrase